jgi:hypothetical protein
MLVCISSTHHCHYYDISIIPTPCPVYGTNEHTDKNFDAENRIERGDSWDDAVAAGGELDVVFDCGFVVGF